MTDSTLEIQDALITALRADVTVTGFVGQRSYDAAPQNPTYPLIELGSSVGDPWEAQDMDGWESIETINVWSDKPGKAQAKEIAKAVVALLHRRPLTLASQQFVLGNLVGSNAVPRGGRTQVALRFQFLTHP